MPSPIAVKVQLSTSTNFASAGVPSSAANTKNTSCVPERSLTSAVTVAHSPTGALTGISAATGPSTASTRTWMLAPSVSGFTLAETLFAPSPKSTPAIAAKSPSLTLASTMLPEPLCSGNSADFSSVSVVVRPRCHAIVSASKVRYGSNASTCSTPARVPWTGSMVPSSLNSSLSMCTER